MTPKEINRKLAFIARLSAEELLGWRWGVKVSGREMFEGEEEALLQREVELRNAIR